MEQDHNLANRFRRGFTRGNGGVFKCHCCGRSTRDVDGGNGGVRLCPQCYEAAGIENEILDGIANADEARARRRELLADAECRGGRVPQDVWNAV